MPVEIRELVIKTNIVSARTREEEILTTEKMLLWKQQIIQECIKALKDKELKNGFDR
ncbi:MAG: DUF5908 family protein [Burkholderiales bacterium]|jgi:hypothetical protein